MYTQVSPRNSSTKLACIVIEVCGGKRESRMRDEAIIGLSQARKRVNKTSWDSVSFQGVSLSFKIRSSSDISK